MSQGLSKKVPVIAIPMLREKQSLDFACPVQAGAQIMGLLRRYRSSQ
jgi:hypothetical protein